MKLKLSICASLLFIATALSAQSDKTSQFLRDKVSIYVNHENGLYEKGDLVKVWADVKSVPEEEVSLIVFKGCDRKNATTTPITLKEGENVLFEEKVDEAVQYIFELTDGKNPSAVKDPAAKGNVFAGFVVDPNGYELGFEEPADLLDFWAKEIKAMRKQKIKTQITKDEIKDNIRTFHVDINCVGPVPCRAYVSYPADAAKKSLPIILNLHAAGQPGAPSKASVSISYVKMLEGGALAMDLNAHGMLDDMPDQFYKDLSRGELKGYSTREPVDKENYYFKWMLLRAQRALDYLCANPLWDGKHVIVTGTSQGGYQSTFLAGIDPRVTTAILTVPAGLDQGAKLKGRKSSWPGTIYKYPEASMANSPYFDAALLAKYAKADFWCEIGLYDTTCPAANLFATLNTVKTPKTIITYQRPHSVQSGLKKQHAPIDELRRQAFKQAVR